MNDSTALNKVDSEIAITALLAAAVAGYPNTELYLYPYIKLAAIGLLALTLVKRVAILNGLTTENSFVEMVTHTMDSATYISFLYLCLLLTRRIEQALANPSQAFHLFIFGAVSIIAIVGLFLISELVFGASLREGGRIFAASAEQHQGEALGILLQHIAHFVNKSRSVDELVTRQTKLTESRFYECSPDDYSQEELLAIVRNFGVLFVSIGFATGSYLLLLIIGMKYFDLAWYSALWLLLAVILVSAFFRLWYSNYGLVQVEERNGFITFLGDSVTYIVTALLVL